MKDHEFAKLFAETTAYLSLGISAFLLICSIAAAGVQASTFSMNSAGQNVASVVSALPDDYGTASAPPAVYCPQLSTTVQKGARDASYSGQVSELQSFLTSYYNLNENIVVGGYFGNLTQKYVVQFQTEQGLPNLGIVGPLTRAKIVSVCGTATSTSAAPIPPSAGTASTSVASEKASITSARAASNADIFSSLLTLVPQVRASTRTDIPALKAFVTTYGDQILSYSSQVQILGQVQIDALSSADLNALLAKYMALRTVRDQILSAYNTISPTQLSQFLLGTPNVTVSTSTVSTFNGTLTLTGPVSGSSYSVKSNMPVSWTVTNVPHTMRVEIITTLVKEADFGSGYVSGGTAMQTVYTGNSSGSITEQWGLNATIPGIYSVALQLEECDPAGCNQYYGPTKVLASTAPLTFTLTADNTPPAAPAAGTTTPSVQVLSPNGGQSFSISGANPVTVSWNAANIPANTTACVTFQSSNNIYYNFPSWPGSCIAVQNGVSSVSGTFITNGSTVFKPGTYIAHVAILNAPNGSGKDAATLAQDNSDAPFTLTN